MRKSSSVIMVLLLILVSTLPGSFPVTFRSASAYAPPPLERPEPTPIPEEQTTESTGSHQVPSFDTPPPEAEEIRALQAIEAVLDKHLRHWGPRYQVAPVEVIIEGDWAHGVAEWQSQAQTVSGPIHVLAHRLPEGFWQALMPSAEGLYLQWVAAVPKSLVSSDEKHQMRAQAAQATAPRQPQATPEVPQPATVIPPADERPGVPVEPIPRLMQPTVTPASSESTTPWPTQTPFPEPETWIAGETSVSQLSQEERAELCGVPAEVIEWEHLQASGESTEPETVYAYPSAKDWRNISGQDWTTPIRNQAGCGSCVSFGTIGSIESRMEIASNDPNSNPDLSESHLFYCGCGECCGSGWWPSAAMSFAQNTGIVDEACYPYTDYDQPCSPCSDWQSRVTKISDWSGTSNTGEMKQALADYGPFEATLKVYDDFFSYSGGIYQHTWGNLAGGHAITIVGYDDIGSYWIAKNSWGTGWGEDKYGNPNGGGWFRIAYGECEIDDYAYVPIVPGSNQVKLYEWANYGGNIVFSGGTGFSNDPNADSYSLEIPIGWSVKTWREDNRGGEERCWSESVPNLQDHGWHLAIQSLEAFDSNVCPPESQVKLYELANYGGNVVFSGGTGFSNDPSANSYSMEVPSGWSVKTWREDNRGGEERCWPESVPNLQDHGWHLAIQSLEAFDSNVCPPVCDPNADQVALYENTDYGGNCVTLDVGEYPYPSYLGDVGNDNAESIKVGSNAQAVLCEHDNYQGRCETFTSDDASLGDNYIGANVVSSVKVQQRDTTPPTGQITSPSDGDVISACPLTIQADASDDQSGVSHVEFHAYYDGGWHHLGDDDTGPYSWNWDCSTVADQGIWLTIHVWDNAGNEVMDPGGYVYITLSRANVGPLTYNGYAVDDDNNDQSSGDGDGIVECGETIELYVSLHNQGSNTASGVDATISTDDSYVTWLYNTSSTYPDVAGGGAGTNSNDFDFAVDPATPHGHIVHFDLDITAANGGPWTDSFDISVACSPTDADLMPSQWGGWQYPVVPSSIPGTSVVNTLYTGYPTYIDWGLTNAGAENTGGNTYGALYIDDDQIGYYDFGDVLAGQTWAFFDWVETVETPGWHTLKSVVDPDDLIAELDETNNVFEHDFYWIPVAPYADDMESGINDWAAAGLWHQVDEYTSPYPQSHSWSHSWWYGQDGTGNYDTGAANSGDLTSPPIYIPDTGHYLRFWYRYETEAQGTDWDQRWVQISVDNGAFSNILQLSDDPMNWWLQSPVLGLSAYAGHIIQVRFHFDTIDSALNDYRGWYIDDFEISTTPPPSCADSHEPNDTPAEATAIAYDQVLNADICPGGDYDFYIFDGTAGDQVVVDIDAEANGSLLDSYILLLDSDGTSVLAENDDEILAEVHDSHLGYHLSHDGTYYIKVKAWNHPSVGDSDCFYDIHLLTDDNSPTAEIISPGHDTWLDPDLQIVTTDVSDNESGIRNVTFYWHDADWEGSDWIVLEDDWDPRDGWTYAFDTSGIPEQPQDCVVFIYAYDWAGNYAGYGSYDLGLERTPPTVSAGVEAMYGDAPFRDFWVTWWNGSDNQSGIASYDVQVRDGASGVWTDLTLGTTETFTRFVGLEDHTYYFRARALDYAGNQSTYAGGDGDTQYTVTTCPTSPDAYETDDAYSDASWITTDGTSQTHNIHSKEGEDWVKLYAATGVTYTLATTNVGGHADTVLYLYDTDGTTLINANDDYPEMWPSSRLDWQPSASGTYYAKVDHWDPWAYGCTTEYGLSIVTNDEVPPAGNVSINEGATYVKTTAVTLNLEGTDVGTGIGQVMASNHSDFGGATWVVYADTLDWTLTSGDGDRAVYLRFRDRAGNESLVCSDTIILDTTPPTGSLLIAGGADVVTDTLVVLTLSATDANDVTHMRLRNDGAAWPAWEPFVASRTWTLPTPLGEHTVWIQFRDVAGNVSTAYSDTVVYSYPYHAHLPLVMRSYP